MKTGFDLAGNNEYEDKKNIVALVTLFAENAIRTSFTYVKHSKRGGVTVEDIKRAIMLETFFFMKRPDVLSKAEAIKKELFAENSDSEEEEEEEEEGVGCNNCYACISGGGKPCSNSCEEIQEFKESECKCALCSCINKIYERWSKWEPNGKMEEILKKAVEEFGTSSHET